MKPNIFFSLIKKETVAINPLIFPVIVVLLCVARWGLIANGFDYGWDFETGYRVYRGGVYGKDFYTAVGPLSYELIGLMFKIFGVRWVIIYFIYYLSWIISILGTYFLLRDISERRENLAFALMILIPLSIPHLSAMHVYNFLSYSLAVWIGVLVFSYLKKASSSKLIIAGILGALSVFAKQNIGLGVVLLSCSVMVLNIFFDKQKSLKKFLFGIGFLSFSFLLSLGFLSWFFSREIGFAELWRLMFTDAASAKGNFLNMLQTSLPRISIGTSDKHNLSWVIQHFFEMGCYVLIMALNLLWYRKFWMASGDAGNKENNAIQIKDLKLLLVVFIVILITPMLFPESVFYIREKFFWLNARFPISRLVMVFGFWLLLTNIGCCFAVLKSKSPCLFVQYKKNILLFIFAFGLTIICCVSKFSYLFLNFPILLGFFFISVLNIRLWSIVQLRWAAFGLLIGIYFFYPTHALGPLTRLDSPKLKGLFFAKAAIGDIEIYTKDLSPFVANKTTLWLTHGGPHSLSGAIPVRNISNIYFDQYNIRIEESLVKGWIANPPEMIVRDWMALAGNSNWLKSEQFESWIKNNYLQVAEISGKKYFSIDFSCH